MITPVAASLIALTARRKTQIEQTDNRKQTAQGAAEEQSAHELPLFRRPWQGLARLFNKYDFPNQIQLTK
jgi:hypothetical protein